MRVATVIRIHREGQARVLEKVLGLTGGLEEDHVAAHWSVWVAVAGGSLKKDCRRARRPNAVAVLVVRPRGHAGRRLVRLEIERVVEKIDGEARRRENSHDGGRRRGLRGATEAAIPRHHTCPRATHVKLPVRLRQITMPPTRKTKQRKPRPWFRDSASSSAKQSRRGDMSSYGDPFPKS